jgi:nucleoid-associated protein EbfC
MLNIIYICKKETMFGKMGDMMGKLQEMKRKTEEAKQRLEEVICIGESASGDIKVRVNGNRKVLSVYIAPAIQHGENEQLEDLISVAINRALDQAEKEYEKEMQKAAGGLLPGMM